MSAARPKLPLQGEIWFTQEGKRPVVIVSADSRNRRERAGTVLAIPPTNGIQKAAPTHVLLPSGETGLQSGCAARAEDITVVPKVNLVEHRGRLRMLSDRRICELAAKVSIAMGCAD